MSDFKSPTKEIEADAPAHLQISMARHFQAFEKAVEQIPMVLSKAVEDVNQLMADALNHYQELKPSNPVSRGDWSPEEDQMLIEAFVFAGEPKHLTTEALNLMTEHIQVKTVGQIRARLRQLLPDQFPIRARRRTAEEADAEVDTALSKVKAVTEDKKKKSRTIAPPVMSKDEDVTTDEETSGSESEGDSDVETSSSVTPTPTPPPPPVPSPKKKKKRKAKTVRRKHKSSL